MNRSILYRLLLSLLLLGSAALALSGIADRKGEAYLEQGLKRALVTFAVSRALNGVISVAQETEVALEPAGVGVTLLPGQILDPVNDLIERFSWVMLAASTSLGLQKLFATIFGWQVFSWVLTAWIVFAIALIWFPRIPGMPPAWRQLVLKSTVVFMVLRFLTPALAFTSEAAYQLFLEARYDSALQGLQSARNEVVEIQAATAPPGDATAADSSLFDRAKALYQSARDGINIGQRMQQLSAIASRTTENAIELIVIFVFQTMIFPLLFLWLTIRLFRFLLPG